MNDINHLSDKEKHPDQGNPQMFKILIVDSNISFRQSLKKILIARFPFVDIKEVSDGDESLGNIETFHPNPNLP